MKNRFCRLFLFVAAALLLPERLSGMDILWTRMAGQWPVEASPLVREETGKAQREILVLNRGGQLLLWAADGTAIGPGQDGTVAQLPAGRWTTAPTFLPGSNRYVVASVEGQVVALDSNFKSLWQHKLPAETVWGRANPALLQGGSLLVFNDRSGTVSCLGIDGTVSWTKSFPGSSKAPPQTFPLGSESLLVPVGSTLFCCHTNGEIRWKCELRAGQAASGATTPDEIVTRPELLFTGKRRIIVCGTSSSNLFALDLQGKILWHCASDDTFSGTLALLQRPGNKPLVIFTGLWGNLHAVDAEGHHAWTHLFRSKVRGAPLVVESDSGHARIFVPTFHQHLYVFDERGQLQDDVRLSGIMPSGVTPIPGPSGSPPDLLVTTTTLLAYRLRPSQPRSPYGETPEPRDLSVSFRENPTENSDSTIPGLLVKNPDGALVNVQLSVAPSDGSKRLVSCLTARSALEIPFPRVTGSDKWSGQVTIRDSTGKLLLEKNWKEPSTYNQNPSPPTETLRAWPTLP